jgi:phosphoribosyl 1,2-cyclic phosphate phosphodiesterase
MARLRLTFLGTGTSMGIPTLGCECRVCRSDDARDNRTRPSVALDYDGRTVLIDTAPDLRFQALRHGLKRIDAVLYTHAHADHILGLDDLRPFNLKQGRVPLFASTFTGGILRQAFPWVFGQATPASTRPEVDFREINGPIDLHGLRITPVPVEHGQLECLGFKFGRAAYVTDFSVIPPDSKELLRDLDLLVLDALRDKPHPNHSTVENSIALVQELKPKQAYFTHIAHDLGHVQTNRRLPAGVELAYDGLSIEVEV